MFPWILAVLLVRNPSFFCMHANMHLCLLPELAEAESKGVLVAFEESWEVELDNALEVMDEINFFDM